MNVYNPYSFESLTLDPGPASAYQGNDQASALLGNIIPIAKGSNPSGVAVQAAPSPGLLDFIIKIPPTPLETVKQDLQELNDLLVNAIQDATTYFDDTSVIYAEVREVASAAPHALDAPRNGIPMGTPDPWTEYDKWSIDLGKKIIKQGNDTTAVLQHLTIACQKKDVDPTPVLGPWLPPPRLCTKTATTEASPTPFAISESDYNTKHEKLLADLKELASVPSNIITFQAEIEQRHERVSQFVQVASVIVPPLIPKYTSDMQTILSAITVARPTILNPVVLGSIVGPDATSKPSDRQTLSVYKALAPSITYTVNAQNEIVNSLLTQPTASQKQSIATISVQFSDPRFEGSTGILFSWLPNRTFSNSTVVGVNGSNVPSSQEIKIVATKTLPPLVIPYVGANYRIGNEFTWLGGCRGAIYGTAAIALNPYNTQLEYAGGFSISWRSIIISPMYHLGRPTHLTQGEQIGQIWCQYGNGATASTNPPACSGNPLAPTTKNYWTGAFTIGIGVRVPNVFSSGK